MRNACRCRSPLQLQSELHVSGVLINGAIWACPVENYCGLGDVSRLQAEQTAVARDLVLQHELEYQVPIEPQLLLDDDAHQTEADGDAGLVIHRAAAEDSISLGIDMSGKRRISPFRGVALGLYVEMAVENKGAAAATSRQANDDVVAARNCADRLDRVGQAAQCGGIHRHQDRSQPNSRHVLADMAHDGVLGLEATRNADQFLEQGSPI